MRYERILGDLARKWAFHYSICYACVPHSPCAPTPAVAASLSTSINYPWAFNNVFRHSAFSDCEDQHRIWGALLRALAEHYIATGQIDETTGEML